MWHLVLILSLPLMATAAPSPTSSSSSSSSSGTSLTGLAVSGAAGVVLGMALAPEPDCRDVGVRGKKFYTHLTLFRSMQTCAP